MRKTLVLRRLGILAAALGVGLLGISAPAGAASPFKIKVPSSNITFSGFCSFPVNIASVALNEYELVTFNADGSVTIKVTGLATATYTNTVTGKSITLNASGPGLQTFFGDGTSTLDITGPNVVLYLPQAQSAFGLPGLQYTYGHVQSTYDSAGNLVSHSLDGTSADLCAALS